MIIDTDILIWYLKGNEKAKNLVHQNLPFTISMVTYVELVQGMRNKKELNSFIKQLTKWNVKTLQINENISTRAMLFVEEYFLSNSMELADALIAATAIVYSEKLLSANTKHYKHIPNIQLEKFTP